MSGVITANDFDVVKIKHDTATGMSYHPMKINIEDTEVEGLAAKLTAAAARLQKAEKIVLLLLLAMAAASGDLAFYPFKKNVHVTGNHRLLD